jgi:hypothetical protein
MAVLPKPYDGSQIQEVVSQVMMAPCDTE